MSYIILNKIYKLLTAAARNVILVIYIISITYLILVVGTKAVIKNIQYIGYFPSSPWCHFSLIAYFVA